MPLSSIAIATYLFDSFSFCLIDEYLCRLCQAARGVEFELAVKVVAAGEEVWRGLRVNRRGEEQDGNEREQSFQLSFSFRLDSFDFLFHLSGKH